MIDLGSIEDALVAALAADAAIKSYAGTVGSFQGQIDAARAAGALKYPILLVGYAGGPTKPFGMFRYVSTLRWQVTVACQNLRSPGAARKTAVEKGAYDVIADVLRVLSGQTLGLPMSELSPTGVEPVESDSTAVAQYAVVFESDVEFDMDDADFCVETNGVIAPQVVSDLETLTADHLVADSTGTPEHVVTDTHEVGE